MRRGVALLTCVALILTLPACSSTKQVPIEKEMARTNTGLMKASGQRVHGYTTTDGKERQWNARNDFAGPQKEFKPLTPWERYAQALLLSNEVMFVD